MELKLEDMPPILSDVGMQTESNLALNASYYRLLKSFRDVLSELIVTNARQEMTTSTVAPTTDDIPENAFTVWKNSTTPDVRLYVNDGGVLKSVVLS